MRLFAVLVGETSKARKGTSLGYIKQILGSVDPEWEENRIQSGLSSGEGLIWAVRDPITKKEKEKGKKTYIDTVVDEGVTDKRLLIIESEFASTLRVMGRDGNTLSPLIRNAWDTGNLQTLTKNTPAKATGAHISILAHITRSEMRYLTETEAANGFGNRFLWFCVQRSKNLPFGGEFTKIDKQPLISKLTEAVNFAKNAGEITWAEETRQLWEEAYAQLAEGKPGMAGAMTARAEANVVRIAAEYAILDLSRLIRPEHLKAALAVWNYAENSVRYIFQDRTGDPLADSILNHLIEQGEVGAGKSQISDFLGRHKSSSQITQALQLLENLHLAKKEYFANNGRPEERWYACDREKSEESGT